MLKDCNNFFLLLLFLSGVKCEQLSQPDTVTVQPGQSLTITCRVSYSVGSHHTAWIRQPEGKELEFIQNARVGYNTNYKDSLKNKFSINLDSSSNTVTLNGQNMHLSMLLCIIVPDTDSNTNHQQAWTKPLKVWTLGTWSHQRRRPKTTNDFRTRPSLFNYCLKHSWCGII